MAPPGPGFSSLPLFLHLLLLCILIFLLFLISPTSALPTGSEQTTTTLLQNETPHPSYHSSCKHPDVAYYNNRFKNQADGTRIRKQCAEIEDTPGTDTVTAAMSSPVFENPQISITMAKKREQPEEWFDDVLWRGTDKQNQKQRLAVAQARSLTIATQYHTLLHHHHSISTGEGETRGKRDISNEAKEVHLKVSPEATASGHGQYPRSLSNATTTTTNKTTTAANTAAAAETPYPLSGHDMRATLIVIIPALLTGTTLIVLLAFACVYCHRRSRSQDIDPKAASVGSSSGDGGSRASVGTGNGSSQRAVFRGKEGTIRSYFSPSKTRGGQQQQPSSSSSSRPRQSDGADDPSYFLNIVSQKLSHHRPFWSLSTIPGSSSGSNGQGAQEGQEEEEEEEEEGEGGKERGRGRGRDINPVVFTTGRESSSTVNRTVRRNNKGRGVSGLRELFADDIGDDDCDDDDDDDGGNSLRGMSSIKKGKEKERNRGSKTLFSNNHHQQAESTSSANSSVNQQYASRDRFMKDPKYSLGRHKRIQELSGSCCENINRSASQGVSEVYFYNTTDEEEEELDSYSDEQISKRYRRGDTLSDEATDGSSSSGGILNTGSSASQEEGEGGGRRFPYLQNDEEEDDGDHDHDFGEGALVNTPPTPEIIRKYNLKSLGKSKEVWVERRLFGRTRLGLQLELEKYDDDDEEEMVEGMEEAAVVDHDLEEDDENDNDRLRAHSYRGDSDNRRQRPTINQELKNSGVDRTITSTSLNIQQQRKSEDPRYYPAIPNGSVDFKHKRSRVNNTTNHPSQKKGTTPNTVIESRNSEAAEEESEVGSEDLLPPPLPLPLPLSQPLRKDVDLRLDRHGLPFNLQAPAVAHASSEEEEEEEEESLVRGVDAFAYKHKEDALRGRAGSSISEGEDVSVSIVQVDGMGSLED